MVLGSAVRLTSLLWILKPTDMTHPSKKAFIGMCIHQASRANLFARSVKNERVDVQ